MLLDLSRFRGEEDRIERRYEPAAFSLTGEEFRLVAPVAFAADVHRDARNVRLKGRIATTLEVNCGRCLEPFAVPVDDAFDLLFLPAEEYVGKAAGEVQEDDFGVTYYRDETIDLGALMREQFFLAVPMKPLCRQDCRGLCPVCGGNRNRETCSCRAEWVDPRLEPLKELKKLKG